MTILEILRKNRPTAQEGICCDHHRRDLSSVFMTVGNADTPWHPQFFSPVTFELAASSSQLAARSSQLAARSSQLAARSRCRVTSVAQHESTQQALTMSFAHS